MRTDDDITEVIIGEAIRIHRRLGPGVFEGPSEAFLANALRNRGLTVEQQLVLPVSFDGVTIPHGYRVDLMVEDRVIVELKSTANPNPVSRRQLLTYLRLSQRRTGLLVTFGFERLTDGIQRVVNGWG
jgi:GxxExxY protein